MSNITIYHNPACGKSRKTLELIRNCGDEPTIIEYLTTPPDKARLQHLLRAMDNVPRTLLREIETPYPKLGLRDSHWTDNELLDLMLEHPILINRPIVKTAVGTRLCRPSETVPDILPSAQRASTSTDDGKVLITVNGQPA